MLISMMKPDFVYESDTGSIKQLVHNGWNQFNIITSVSGAIRGGHYHKYNKESFYIINGLFKLIVWKDNIKEEYIMKAGDMFFIYPYVFHTFEYLEDTVLVSLYSKGVELSETEKDIWTD